MSGSFIYPPRLHTGDVIGIAAPSTPIGAAHRAQLEHGTAFLKSLGFEVRLAPQVETHSLGFAASGAEKAADLHALFADPDIQAIMCAQGGMTANACLAHLDWDVIRSHPKPFIGISDITVLLTAITARTGLVTFHGDDLLWGFGRRNTVYNRSEFLAGLVAGRSGPIPPNRPRRVLRSGTAQGRLWGGNLTALLKLAGTPCWPDLSDAILFLEDIDLAADRCDCELTQLLHLGVFDRIAGVIIGFIDGQDGISEPGQSLGEILLRLTPDHGFPILKTEDFGHNCPNTVVPVGGLARIDADRLTWELLEPAVA